MKRYLIILSIFLFVYGCASGGLTTREKGALAGAGLGATAGAVIGHQVGHTGSGAAIGGALGAASGALVGDKMQAQDQEIQEAKTEAQRAREEAAEAKREARKKKIAKPRRNCEDYFEKARIAANPEDKVYFYKKGLRLCPNNASAHNRLGEIYLKMKKKKDAEYQFRRALEINPDYYPAQRNLDKLE
jgi:tetratricopeptide (TPR) repeat protein